MSILTALTALKTAAATVDGLVVFDLNDTVIPPAVVFGLPTILAETFQSPGNPAGLSTATFDCYLIASAGNGFAVEELLSNLNALLIAIETQTVATISQVTPGTFVLDTGPGLPSYSLTVTYPLSNESS